MSFNKILKHFGKSQKPGFVYDQAVIVDINFEGLDDFGTKEEQSAIQTLEREIEQNLPPSSGIDGDA